MQTKYVFFFIKYTSKDVHQKRHRGTAIQLANYVASVFVCILIFSYHANLTWKEGKENFVSCFLKSCHFPAEEA